MGLASLRLQAWMHVCVCLHLSLFSLGVLLIHFEVHSSSRYKYVDRLNKSYVTHPGLEEELITSCHFASWEHMQYINLLQVQFIVGTIFIQ